MWRETLHARELHVSPRPPQPPYMSRGESTRAPPGPLAATLLWIMAVMPDPNPAQGKSDVAGVLVTLGRISCHPCHEER
jgi:hypothetical protein